MKILVVDVAQYGNEHTTLQSFRDDRPGGGGGEKLSRDMSMARQVEHIAALAGQYDFVCVDETGVGAAVVDSLRHLGVSNLLIGRSHAAL